MADSYSELEVQQILQKALTRSTRSGENLTRAQILEIAKELGVSEVDFAQAETEWQLESQRNTDRAEFIQFSRKKFRDSLVTYALVNGALILFNFLTVKSLSWSAYPLLFWGVFILLRGWSVIATDGDSFERKFQQWHNQRQQERMAGHFARKLTNTAITAVNMTDKIANKLSQKVEKWLDDR